MMISLSNLYLFDLFFKKIFIECFLDFNNDNCIKFGMCWMGIYVVYLMFLEMFENCIFLYVY